MLSRPETEEFHHIEIESANLSAEEFLKRRLSYLKDNFAYEELSGRSIDKLQQEEEYFRLLVRDTYNQFTNEESILADCEYAAFLTNSEFDLYEPLSEAQRWEIVSTINEINRNFDKAVEDAKDRRFERLGSVTSSIPLINRLSK